MRVNAYVCPDRNRIIDSFGFYLKTACYSLGFYLKCAVYSFGFCLKHTAFLESAVRLWEKKLRAV